MFGISTMQFLPLTSCKAKLWLLKSGERCCWRCNLFMLTFSPEFQLILRILWLILAVEGVNLRSKGRFASKVAEKMSFQNEKLKSLRLFVGVNDILQWLCRPNTTTDGRKEQIILWKNPFLSQIRCCLSSATCCWPVHFKPLIRSNLLLWAVFSLSATTFRDNCLS